METAGRYETRCVSCGTVLRNIDRPETQTCRCGETLAHHGQVFDGKVKKPKRGEQTAMFDSPAEYPE